eukprot:5357682-Ditylum_brightwellii.AAC.2
MVILSHTLSGLSQMRVVGKRVESLHATLCNLNTAKLTKKCTNMKNDANHILKCWHQTVETTQSNETLSDEDGKKTVRYEIPPSNAPHSEEQGGEHQTTSSCAIGQLQYQPVSDLSLEEIADSEENGTKQVDPDTPDVATDAAIDQSSEINNEFPFSPDERENEATLVEINGFWWKESHLPLRYLLSTEEVQWVDF